ncbi:MAG: adenosylcobinamide amidohydrolase [Proteobacteria bacterium]|nr:adenosylcobinamide amidohydrolase [Pseudomonadota bacterium]
MPSKPSSSRRSAFLWLGGFSEFGLSNGAALVEAITIAAQARTTAILDSRVSRSGVVITGTGTDCIVVSAPLGGSVRFAGLHTAIGEAIGASVYRAMRDGIATSLLDTETMRLAVGFER